MGKVRFPLATKGNEGNNTNEMEKDILEQTKGVAVEVYKDALKPSVQPIGTMLSYLPRTIRLAFSRWEKWIVSGEESIRLTAESLKDKLALVPQEKLVEPEAYVAVPAMQQLLYCQDNEALRNLYANLLSSSMNIDKKWQVHPSFVDIIKQITPDEAKNMNSIPNFKNNFMPLIDVQLFDKNSAGKGGHQLFVTNFTNIGIDIIERKNNICAYVDNLVRLKLLEIPATYHLTDISEYKPLEEHPILQAMIPEEYKQVYDIRYRHKALQITNFGLLFKNVCCGK